VISGIGALVLVGLIVALATGEASDADRDHGSSAVRSSTPSLLAVTHRGVVGSAHPCGVRSAATLASVDTQVAQRIYADELEGRETLIDQAHVRQSPALLRALSSGNTAAIVSAVHAIVYTPHWHIVRLRVLRAGHVIADVGGPDVIAPVTGVLKEHGRTLGRYVMSVQDDVGYVKLVSRFIGVPIDLYRGSSFLMGTLQPAPSLARSEATLIGRGGAYRAQVFAAGGFPAVALNVALLVPLPPPSVSSMSCQQIQANAWGSVAMHIAARLKPLSAHYRDLVGVVRAASGASVFVRSGRHEIAGANVPRHLPTEGSVRISGRSRGVFSWLAAPGVRVYVVAPA
jgi:hypothetical protein